MIAGTAGHVDHGMTPAVHALTVVDTLHQRGRHVRRILHPII
jgi:translation initiation factor 2 gamma subunit (eIF-2gamma)